MYVTGSGSHAVIVIYDIFGFQDQCPQVKQVCDRLAAYGFLVVVPDIFVNNNNKPWPIDKFPPKPEDNLSAWIAGSDGSFFYTECLSQLQVCKKYLAGKGVTSHSTMGFCWGGYICMRFGGEATEGLRSTIAVHAAFWDKEKDFAKNLKVPICVVAAKGDP
ncbi:hypothetical protein GUITHDRAFT_155384, partial [Guillardia theta CCMP2712]